MISFSEYKNTLNEVLITFGKKQYPRFGHVVILAGGAASGKGFIKDKLMGIEGKTLDVDELKRLVLLSTKIKEKIKKIYGVNIDDFYLRNPEHVGKLHELVKGLNLANKKEEKLFTAIASGAPDRKPNVIFDVTLSDFDKFNYITQEVAKIGYKKENIHIVWVINDMEVAIEQNHERERIVAEDVLISTHEGAARTLKEIITEGKKLRKFMDGIITFAFNKRGTDSEVHVSKIVNLKSLEKDLEKASKNADYDKVIKISNEIEKFKQKFNGVRLGSGGFYVVKSNYITLKEQGKQIDESKLTKSIEAKINIYSKNNFKK